MIELQHVSKGFNGVTVIDDLCLHIARGEFTVILGSSGSGKSTLLKMINRLLEHDSGRILFAGDEIRSFRPEDIRRRMGYAIQSVGLFPHWSVEKNIATVPTLLKWPSDRIHARVTGSSAPKGSSISSTSVHSTRSRAPRCNWRLRA